MLLYKQAFIPENSVIRRSGWVGGGHSPINVERLTVVKCSLLSQVALSIQAYSDPLEGCWQPFCLVSVSLAPSLWNVLETIWYFPPTFVQVWLQIEAIPKIP